jgi:hypothetical protein
MNARPTYIRSFGLPEDGNRDSVIQAIVELCEQQGRDNATVDGHNNGALLTRLACNHMHAMWREDVNWADAAADAVSSTPITDEMFALLHKDSDDTELGRLFHKAAHRAFAQDCLNLAEGDA